MRFYVTGKKPLRLGQLRTALRQQDKAYDIEIPDADNPRFGILKYADVVYAEVEISEPGDGSFEDDLAEQLDAVASSKGKWKALVEEMLNQTRRIVVVCVRFGKRGVEETLVRIDPLWDWLYTARGGVLHAEGEGFYDIDGPRLKL
jgi:hypothetical protein